MALTMKERVRRSPSLRVYEAQDGVTVTLMNELREPPHVLREWIAYC